MRTVILLIGLLASLTLINLSDTFFGYFSGFYCPLGSAYPQPCEAGSYCNQTGLDAPAGPCAAGYFCPKGSFDPYTTSCPIGHYCPLGTPLPLPCPLGTIKSEKTALLYYSCNFLIHLKIRCIVRFSEQFNCLKFLLVLRVFSSIE